jgi:hypothetical protein
MTYHFMFNKMKCMKNIHDMRRAESFLLTCNVMKNYFVTLFFILLRYATVFNFPLHYCITLHNFFVTLRFFRYVTFQLQIPDLVRAETFGSIIYFHYKCSSLNCELTKKSS